MDVALDDLGPVGGWEQLDLDVGSAARDLLRAERLLATTLGGGRVRLLG